MSVFGAYARYYDLLYNDKDYRAETAFVDRLIREHAPGVENILELGCGTGRHAECLVEMGYRLHGVDASEEMLEAALHRKSHLTDDARENLKFSCGDIRSVRLGQSFDAVVSLFHVMSYQTSNRDLSNALATARAHLARGGLFLFDCWYGPAVFNARPEVRIKHLGDENVEIIRFAEPEWNVNRNTVTVNYDINIIEKGSRQHSRFSESHCMRYLFLPEIEDLLARHGMSPVVMCEWLSGRTPDSDSWNLCIVARVESL